MSSSDETESQSGRKKSMVASQDPQNLLSQNSAHKVGRKRIIDETKLDPEEAKLLEVKRAYNRECAAKARKKSRDMIAHLTQKLEEATNRETELQKDNEMMRAKLLLLENQKQQLLLDQQVLIDQLALFHNTRLDTHPSSIEALSHLQSTVAGVEFPYSLTGHSRQNTINSVQEQLDFNAVARIAALQQAGMNNVFRTNLVQQLQNANDRIRSSTDNNVSLSRDSQMASAFYLANPTIASLRNADVGIERINDFNFTTPYSVEQNVGGSRYNDILFSTLTER